MVRIVFLPEPFFLSLRVLVPLVILLTGCSSVSTLQTARTLEPGDVRFFVGAGYSRNPSQNPFVIGSADISRVNFPVFELGVRVGATQDWDLGVKITLPGTVPSMSNTPSTRKSDSPWGWGPGRVTLPSFPAASRTEAVFPPTFSI